MTEIIFLKLGGSVITDKTVPYSPRLDSLERLAREVASALANRPDLRLVIGHGSGSFGHFAVKESLSPHRFPAPDEDGVRNYWRGFAEVWYRASQLNRCVVEALHAAGLPVISFAPSAMASAENGRIPAGTPPRSSGRSTPAWCRSFTGISPSIWSEAARSSRPRC